VQFGCEGVNLTGQVGVGLQLEFLRLEVVVGLGLLEGRLAILSDHHERRQKIASSETTSVRVGHGLRSKNTIHTAKSTACKNAKLIEPAKAVMRSATRSWKLSFRRIASSITAG
jgi:hypothetical protein